MLTHNASPMVLEVPQRRRCCTNSTPKGRECSGSIGCCARTSGSLCECSSNRLTSENSSSSRNRSTRVALPPPNPWSLLSCFLLFSVHAWACDVSKGSWVETNEPPRYQCQLFPGNPGARNASTRYVWKPAECDIQRFDPIKFSAVLSNKTIVFVGGSLSKNMWAALLCALSEATPVQPVKSGNRRQLKGMQGHHLPHFNATILNIRSPFWVGQVKTPARGSRIAALDVVDPAWASMLNSADFIVFGGLHHISHKKVSFVINGTKVEGLDPAAAIAKASGTVRDYLESVDYKGTPFVVTYSPDHGQAVFQRHHNCAGSHHPLEREQESHARGVSTAMAIRDKQVQVFAHSSHFKVIDITALSFGRADAHPGSASGAPFSSKADCSHWCLPGVPDVWVDIMFSHIKSTI